MSKFTFPASLFLVMLSAQGFDHLARSRGVKPRTITIVVLAAVCLLLAGLAVQLLPWQEVTGWIRAKGESYLAPSLYDNLKFIKYAQIGSSSALFLASASLGILGALLFFLKKKPSILLYAILTLAVAEVFLHARASLVTFDMTSMTNPKVRQLVAGMPGDYRIMNLRHPNSALLLGAQDLWGGDPMVVHRYAEFMTWTQGGNPDQATQNVNFTYIDPLYAMLRLKFAIVSGRGDVQIQEVPTPPMPHLMLISQYQVLKKRDAIFAAMRNPAFDPRKEVILESTPGFASHKAGNTGTAQVVKSSSDYLVIEADIKQPSILLITDTYTPSWHAVALPGSAQQHYDLQPANYILRAIPLKAGHHRLRVEYVPRDFRAGVWISLVLWPAYVIAVIVFIVRRRKKGKSGNDKGVSMAP